MTQSATAPITAKAMLAEAQVYRTSLESLMEVGRSLLLQPSMEDSAAVAYKVLAEGVLESADHQADLTAVDGVTEPAAVVELIMQDVLTPRLTDIEEIEQSLQIKADSEEPVPFTTRDAETSASMESKFHKAEVLGLFKDHVSDIKTIIASMEGLDVEVIRPMVVRLLERAGDGAAAVGVSLESVAQTQVLGEMADAVDRIETLVNKAHDEAMAASEAARSASEGIGSDGTDKLGDVIEAHRGDAVVGPQLAEGTSATTVENDTPSNTADDSAAEGSGDSEADSGESIADESEGGLPLEDAVDENAEAVAAEASADADLDEGEAAADADVDLDGDGAADTSSEEEEDADLQAIDDDTSADDHGLPDGTDDVELDEGETSDDASDESSEEEEESDDDEDEEEEDESKPSTESLNPSVVIDSMANHTEDQSARRDVIATLLDACSGLELLSEKGQAAIAGGVDDNFELTSDMFIPATGEILVRHYETWAAAAIRDGGANVRALLALVNN